jgi:hypothetical protein
MHIRLVCAQGEEEHHRLLVIARGAFDSLTGV